MDSSTTNALQNVLDILKIQDTRVKKVSVLANFSIDKIASLEHGQQIVQGLVVQVSKDYKMSSADMAWFHPEIGSGRSVFEVDQYVQQSKLTAMNLDGLQSSVGEYSISHPDEFGCEEVQHHIVVDTSCTSTLQSLYKKWLTTGMSAGEIDKQWKRMKFDNVHGIPQATQEMRQQIAREISPTAKLVYSDTIRSVLSDTSSVYFTNNVVKEENNGILVKSSALGGYRMYSSNNESIRFYPATLGTAANYYSWSAMAPKNCERIEKSCSWGGELTFNVAVMMPPAITGKDIRKMEDNYEMSFRDTLTMNNARFSPSDKIRDSMPPSDMVSLHPGPEHSSSSQSFISAPVSVEHPVLKNLLNNLHSIGQQFPNFQLLNPAIIQGGRLHIPQEIYKQFA